MTKARLLWVEKELVYIQETLFPFISYPIYRTQEVQLHFVDLLPTEFCFSTDAFNFFNNTITNKQIHEI